MARTRVSLDGADALKAKLAQLEEQADAAIVAALRSWGSDVRDAARDLVPVETGTLRASISVRVEPGSLNAMVGVWNAAAYYSRWVEMGNSRQEAQPFLLPAYERNRRKFRKHLRGELTRRLG